MSYESRAYDNEHGDPVVVLVVTGTHDVSRLVNMMNGGGPNCEQRDLGRAIAHQVKRRNAGRRALALLRDHGGPDFLDDPDDESAARVAQARGHADLAVKLGVSQRPGSKAGSR